MIDIFENLRRQVLSDDPYALFVEMALIALVINWCVGVLQGTRGTRLFKGILVVLIVSTLGVRVLAEQFSWTRLALLYQYFLIGLAFMALVAFQPELRRAFIRVGDVRFHRRGTPQSKLIAALVESAGYLSRNKFGALIAIQRGVGLRGWAENGTLLNAEVSANMLNTIFYPPSPLHDLGVIIQGTRILAANCQFPQAESDEVDAGLGSRHRAAVGLSYESDALVLVVSEETGTISLAEGGKLTRYLTLEDLGDELTERLSGVKTATRTKKGVHDLHDAWRVIRRVLLVVPLTFVVWYVADQAAQIQSPTIKVEIHPVHEDPNRTVEITDPSPPIFSVTFRGSTSNINEIRDMATDRALTIDWSIAEAYTADGEHRPDAKRIIQEGRDILRRGLKVVSVSPPEMTMVVDSLVKRRMPVRADTGNINVTDVRIEPPEVDVTLRSRDLARLSEAQRFVTVPLNALVNPSNMEREQSFENAAVSPRLAVGTAVRIDPQAVNVGLRVIGQEVTDTIRGVAIDIQSSYMLYQQYTVELRDPQERFVDIKVRGEKSVIDALKESNAISAYLRVTTDQTLGTDWQPAQVHVSLPPNVKLIPPEPTVQIRVVKRQDQTP
jgi:diadenylate cyclase